MEKNRKFNLVATAASGLEALVGKELRDLGIECQVENGRARFEGTMETIATANLWLRTADRVKIVVGEFDAYTFDELFENVKALPWEDFLPLDAAFPVAGKSIKSKLYSTPDCQAITKKAIAERPCDGNSGYDRTKFIQTWLSLRKRWSTIERKHGSSTYYVDKLAKRPSIL